MIRDLKQYIVRVYRRALEEDILTNAAQVAFYFIFALFPLLLFLLSVFGMVIGSADKLQNELFAYLSQVIPPSALDVIQDALEEVTEGGSAGKLTFGALVALWSASAGVDAVRTALNNVYNLTETRPFWKYRLVSLLITLSITILIFLAIGIVFYGAQFLNIALYPTGFSIENSVLLQIFSFAVVAFALILSFALIYSLAPDHPVFAWTWITPGAIVAIVLWIVFSLAFRVYLHYFDSYSKTYGSVGAIIILLLWLYLTALVILIGGVVNAVGEEMEKKGEFDEIGEDSDSISVADNITQTAKSSEIASE